MVTKILVKSPDRVATLLALDALNAGQMAEKFDGVDSYAIWCVGVNVESLKDRLAVACQFPYELSDADPSELGEPMGGSI